MSEKHSRKSLRCDRFDILSGAKDAWHYRLRGGIEVYIQLDDGRVVSARVPAKSVRRFVEEEERGDE